MTIHYYKLISVQFQGGNDFKMGKFQRIIPSKSFSKETFQDMPITKNRT